MYEAVVFKGFRSGLQMVVDEQADFAVILHHLKEKLDSAASFFTAGTLVRVAAKRDFSNEEKQVLTDILANYGLKWEAVALEKEEKPVETVAEAFEAEDYKTPALIVRRTLRSGQKVVAAGSVVVLGDVNPGAEVIAGKDIIVMGACRGIAHAGAGGDERATITATKLLAAQLRIAGLIARSPDKLDKPAYAETARIADGSVLIEPAIR